MIRDATTPQCVTNALPAAQAMSSLQGKCLRAKEKALSLGAFNLELHGELPWCGILWEPFP